MIGCSGGRTEPPPPPPPLPPPQPAASTPTARAAVAPANKSMARCAEGVERFRTHRAIARPALQREDRQLVALTCDIAAVPRVVRGGAAQVPSKVLLAVPHVRDGWGVNVVGRLPAPELLAG